MWKRRYVTSLLVGIALGSVGLTLGFAASAGPAAAATEQQNLGTIAQTYTAGPGVLAGMIVGLQSKDQRTVIPLQSENIHEMTGVVVPIADANIVLTPPAVTNQQVLVASGGRYELLVSDQNGPVKSGNFITISALDGIGMKAGPEQAEVIGRALGDFDGKTGVIDTEQLKSNLGNKTTVAVGHIPVDIRLAPNPLYQSSNNLPDFLSHAANSVAHKDVQPFRVYLSLSILLATVFITGVMFYGGIRGGIIAIGRNPLAKGAIGRGLIRAVALGLIVFAIGVLGAYIILL